MSSPTSRTKKLLEKQGYKVAITERWNQFAHIRQDLFGIIDILAIGPISFPGVIWGFQVTSGDHVANRIQKALATPSLIVWLKSGGKFSVVGWRKVGERGKRKLWQPRFADAAFNENNNLVFVERNESVESLS